MATVYLFPLLFMCKTWFSEPCKVVYLITRWIPNWCNQLRNLNFYVYAGILEVVGSRHIGFFLIL